MKGAMRRALLLLGLALAQASLAQYPARPIRWIVPYTPAGVTDSVTRIVTQRLEAPLGQPVVVENRPGANSIVGAEAVARAAPDGHTALTVIAAHAANATLYAGRLSFDPVKSFSPVTLVALAPLILVVNNDFPARDVKELVDYARANPGKVSYGSSGVGSGAHLTTELLEQTARIDMQHVAYKGTSPALTALLAGDIQVLVDVPITMMPQVRAHKVRALGLFAAKRMAGAPEVPTLAEAGGPPIEAATWVMFLMPAGTPREIVSRVSAETANVLAMPDIRARFEQLGVEPVGSTPAEAARFLDEEIAKWAKVVTTANVKAE
jgi:tripartite-type tricarboxylate transporter receptor subunit TctC